MAAERSLFLSIMSVWCSDNVDAEKMKEDAEKKSDNVDAGMRKEFCKHNIYYTPNKKFCFEPQSCDLEK